MVKIPSNNSLLNQKIYQGFDFKINFVIKKAHYIITKKIIPNPSAIKKIFQLTMIFYKGSDLYIHGEYKERKFTSFLKDSTEAIDFYSTYKNIMFWVNPFSKDNLDQKALLQSLKQEIKNQSKNPYLTQNFINVRADAAVRELLKSEEEFYSKEHVKLALRAALVKNNNYYTDSQAQSIVEKLVITKQSRSYLEVLTRAFDTFSGIVGNAETLNRWGMIEFGKVAAKVGTQTPVYAFAIKTTSGTVLAIMGAFSTSVSLRQVLKKGYALIRQSDLKDDEKEKVKRAFKEVVLDGISLGADLAGTVLPLIFNINRPVTIGLAFIAKGTGLFSICYKK